ncbi:hypothetical protein IW262DRAFT_1322892 [Armillaria fumosa]|nr:hypothetical protein IW262DRAFT_1322892 [Armillaria fumosa]
MAVIIFIEPPPPPYLLMDPFPRRRTPPKNVYRSQSRRRRDALRTSEQSPADDEALQNHADPLPPSPQADGAERPRTPPPNDATKPASWITGQTPYSRGTNSLQIVEPSEKIGPVDEYLQVDLCHRVFMHFDMFLQTILLLPEDWRKEYKSAIDEVLNDKQFDQLLNAYLKKADIKSVAHDREKRLYRPHAKMHNRAIDVLQTHPKTTVFDSNVVRIIRSDPLTVRGSMDHLKPDIVGMFTDIFASATDQESLLALEKYGAAQDAAKTIAQEKKCELPSKDDIPAWPQLINVVEMKAADNALDEGTQAIRLLKDGEDPLKPMPQKSRKPRAVTENLTSEVEEDADGTPSIPSEASSMTNKRKLDSDGDESSSKVSRQSKSQATASVRRTFGAFDKNGHPRTLPNDEAARIQCAQYAMQILSSAGLRSHALVTLIDRDRLQLQYYDRSSIVVSQAIDIADKEERRLFIAMLIGCHRLKLRQRGILHDILPDPYIQSYGKMKGKNPVNLFKGLKMTLQNAKGEDIILTLGDIIHRQRGLSGRNTCVVFASSPTWKDRELVVKISWPGVYRDSEKKLMDRAKAKAEEMSPGGERHWVLDHLPEILHSQDFRFDKEDSPQKRLMKLLIKAKYAEERSFIYEERVLRITVSERLFPITDLTDVKDIAQVFFDIFRCHHWLYENPQILHRDMSLNNMMYRKRSIGKGKIRILGVLNDFDLSSVIPLQEATSLHRTGTPPYMAHELVGQSDVGHLYRHDIEAFYYVLLMLCCRYKIVWSAEGKVMKELSENKKDLPFERWYDRTMSWETLADVKFRFLAGRQPISPSKTFSAFLPWLNAIRLLFRQGLYALATSEIPQTCLPSHLTLPGTMQPSVPFDNETLGGHITFEYILQIMSEIDGHSLNK